MDLKKYYYINITSEDQEEIISSVKSNAVFRGFNLWVLVFAIFIASLGLNVNSTAVIIGAMLISPLMGPIIGMGLSIGISDFELLKTSFKNYAIATAVSVITAMIYFLLSPINEAQSELLARTSPNIYDVLIALFGGLAGVVAICAREKGNVIPGVAIATALMPPLCTAGYGLAQGEWMYFFGAFYLFFINTVFISLATFLGVRFFNFRRATFVDNKQGTLIHRYIMAIVIITILPALYMTVNIVRESIFVSSANKFINTEMQFEGTQVIQRDISYDESSIRVVLLGEEIADHTIDSVRSRMQYYRLGNASLSILQGARGDSLDITTLRKSIVSDIYDKEEKIIKEQKKDITTLEQKLVQYESNEELTKSICPELKALFPKIKSISISRAVRAYTNDSKQTETICLVSISTSGSIPVAETKKMHEWLEARIGTKVILANEN